MTIKELQKDLNQEYKKYKKENKNDNYIMECWNEGLQSIKLEEINKNYIYNVVSFDNGELVISFTRDKEDIKRDNDILEKWNKDIKLNDKEEERFSKIDLDYYCQDENFYTIKIEV